MPIEYKKYLKKYVYFKGNSIDANNSNIWQSPEEPNS